MLYRSILIGFLAVCDSATTKIFGESFDENGNKFDEYVSNYFAENFGAGGTQYLTEVATLSDDYFIAQKVLVLHAGFVTSMRMEIKEIVGGFSRVKSKSIGQRGLAIVVLRVHRLIGILESLKMNGWRLDNAMTYYDYGTVAKPNARLSFLRKLKTFGGLLKTRTQVFVTSALRVIGSMVIGRINISNPFIELSFEFLTDCDKFANPEKEITQRAPRFWFVTSLMDNVTYRRYEITDAYERLTFFEKFYPDMANAIDKSNVSDAICPQEMTSEESSLVTAVDRAVSIVHNVVLFGGENYALSLIDVGQAEFACPPTSGSLGTKLLSQVYAVSCFVNQVQSLLHVSKIDTCEKVASMRNALHVLVRDLAIDLPILEQVFPSSQTAIAFDKSINELLRLGFPSSRNYYLAVFSKLRYTFAEKSFGFKSKLLGAVEAAMTPAKGSVSTAQAPTGVFDAPKLSRVIRVLGALELILVDEENKFDGHVVQHDVPLPGFIDMIPSVKSVKDAEMQLLLLRLISRIGWSGGHWLREFNQSLIKYITLVVEKYKSGDEIVRIGLKAITGRLLGEIEKQVPLSADIYALESAMTTLLRSFQVRLDAISSTVTFQWTDLSSKCSESPSLQSLKQTLTEFARFMYADCVQTSTTTASTDCTSQPAFRQLAAETTRFWPRQITVCPSEAIVTQYLGRLRAYLLSQPRKH
jgi:hypothetical protein